MELVLRSEEEGELEHVIQVVKKSFAKEILSDKTEHHLVKSLRSSQAFIPELSIVAVLKNEIVGYILFTKVSIMSEVKVFTSLGLAPVCVIPDLQNKGIGGKLISYGHFKAKELGFDSVMLIGHKNYYPRFGYKLSSTFGISFPFEAPEENCMAIELVKGSLKEVSGKIKYPDEFY